MIRLQKIIDSTNTIAHVTLHPNANAFHLQVIKEALIYYYYYYIIIINNNYNNNNNNNNNDNDDDDDEVLA